MDIDQFIKPELLILIPVLYVVGLAIKKSKIKDKYIPVILGGIGIVLSGLWVFATSNISSVREILGAIFTSLTQGILTAGASVYINQLFVQKNKN